MTAKKKPATRDGKSSVASRVTVAESTLILMRRLDQLEAAMDKRFEAIHEKLNTQGSKLDKIWGGIIALSAAATLVVALAAIFVPPLLNGAS